MSKYTHYAVYVIAGPIYGIGKTPKTAHVDAIVNSLDRIAWCPSIPLLQRNRDEHIVGRLAIAPCTAALAALVEKEGDDVPYLDEHDGLDVQPEEGA